MKGSQFISKVFSRKGLVISIYGFAVVIFLNGVFFFLYLNSLNIRDSESARMQHVEQEVTQLVEASLTLDQVLSDGDGGPSAAYNQQIGILQAALDTVRYRTKKLEYPAALYNTLSEQMDGPLNHHRQYQLAIQSRDSATIANLSAGVVSLVTPAREFLAGVQQVHTAQQQELMASVSVYRNVMTVLQVLALISVPFIVLMVIAFRINRNKLLALLQAVDDSNTKYVFNSLETYDVNDEEEVKSRLLKNLKKAADFIQRIAGGDYSVKWEGINDSNRDLNLDNIAGELIKMREQMKEVKEQDRIRIWTTEGLSQFGDVIRKHQNNFEELSDTIIKGLVKYLGAKVGGLYILEEPEDGQSFLELRACYAFERKKYLNRRIEIGEGLVGQTYLEGKTIHLKEVPENYITITSGLGDTAPKSLLVVPLRTNEKIEGVLELASLNEFRSYEIEFLEKFGEALAASIISVRTNEKTHHLLMTSQEQSEEMRAQEEEMRQNMEELEATQEQMQRQVAELNELRKNMEQEEQLFAALMNNIPDAVYFKDKQSKFIRVSKYLADRFRVNVKELIGKSDFDIQDEVHARAAAEDEQQIMQTDTAKVDFVEKETHKDGSEHFVSTTKMPLKDADGQVIGTFGISRDITKLKRLEIDILNREKKFKAEEEEYENRIRMLERKISAKEEEIQELKRRK